MPYDSELKTELHVISTKSLRKVLLRVSERYISVCISTILAATPGKIYSVHELVDILHGNKIDGGPEMANKSIHVIACRLRHSGFPIVSHGHRGYSYETNAPR